MMVLLPEQLGEPKLGLDLELSLNQTKHSHASNSNCQWHLENVHSAKAEHDGEAEYLKMSLSFM